MWERMAFDSILGMIFGEGFNYATRNMRKAKRNAIVAGMLIWVGIWMLCLLGERLIPPLQALRQCFDERTWLLGKSVVWLLALPVGFPVGSVIVYRHLKRKAERAEAAGLDPETGLPVGTVSDPIQVQAQRVRHRYEVVVAVLLWVWYWFFSPVSSWLEQGGRESLGQTTCLLVLWLLLAALLGGVGGRIVYRCTERRLRRGS